MTTMKKLRKTRRKTKMLPRAESFAARGGVALHLDSTHAGKSVDTVALVCLHITFTQHTQAVGRKSC